MKKNQETEKKQQELVSKPVIPESEPKPYLKWSFKPNKKTGEQEFDSIQLSDKSELTEKSIKRAMKSSTGTSNIALGELIINKISRGMAADRSEVRLNDG